MIDLDGNGHLSWDEINEICTKSLSIFNINGKSEFIKNLANFFTDYIFQQCGYDIDVFKYKGDRIPSSERRRDEELSPGV